MEIEGIDDKKGKLQMLNLLPEVELKLQLDISVFRGKRELIGGKFRQSLPQWVNLNQNGLWEEIYRLRMVKL